MPSEVQPDPRNMEKIARQVTDPELKVPTHKPWLSFGHCRRSTMPFFTNDSSQPNGELSWTYYEIAENIPTFRMRVEQRRTHATRGMMQTPLPPFDSPYATDGTESLTMLTTKSRRSGRAVSGCALRCAHSQRRQESWARQPKYRGSMAPQQSNLYYA